LKNLRNAIVVFFGLRNEFVNAQGNKKRNTQNIQVKQKINTHLNFSGLYNIKTTHRVDYSAMAIGQGPLRQKVKIIGGVTNMYQKVQ
jgi:hypothetical protein